MSTTYKKRRALRDAGLRAGIVGELSDAEVERAWKVLRRTSGFPLLSKLRARRLPKHKRTTRGYRTPRRTVG